MGNMHLRSRRDPTERGQIEAAKIARLTNKEREIVTFICKGFKNNRIAECLSISETTVLHHLTSIFDKLQVSDRLELVIYAYHYGLATLPQ